MKDSLTLALALVCGLCAGCAGFVQAPFVPPPGFVVTDVKAPLSVDFESTPVAEKQGKSEAQYLLVPCFWGPLFSVAWGDCSIEEAAAEGNLKTVHYADYELLSILGIYQKTTVKAYGK